MRSPRLARRPDRSHHDAPIAAATASSSRLASVRAIAAAGVADARSIPTPHRLSRTSNAPRATPREPTTSPLSPDSFRLSEPTGGTVPPFANSHAFDAALERATATPPMAAANAPASRACRQARPARPHRASAGSTSFATTSAREPSTRSARRSNAQHDRSSRRPAAPRHRLLWSLRLRARWFRWLVATRDDAFPTRSTNADAPAPRVSFRVPACPAFRTSRASSSPALQELDQFRSVTARAVRERSRRRLQTVLAETHRPLGPIACESPPARARRPPA